MPLRTLVLLLGGTAVVTAGVTLGYREATDRLESRYAERSQADTSHALVERLAERARELWRLRDEADYTHVYDFYDPDFRDRVSRKEFVQSQGYMLFSDSELLASEVREGERGRTLVRAHWLATRNCFRVGEPRSPRPAVAEELWSFDGQEWHLTAQLRWLSSAESDGLADL